MPSLDWRRVSKITVALLVFPPWGLWLLWKDPVLSRGVKQRIFIYSIAAMIVLTLLIGLLELHWVRHSLQNAGIDF